jgi:uncharacterized protein YkwD
MSIRNKIVIGTSVVLLACIGGGYGIYHATHEYPRSTNPNPPVTTPEPRISPDLTQLYTLTNQDRKQAGEAPLTLNPKLNDSAEAKCKDMQSKVYWAHDAPDGTSWTSFIRATTGAQIIGENLAHGYTTATDVNTAWMNSAGHRKNILDANFTDVGFAECDVTGYSLTVVQHFAEL